MSDECPQVAHVRVGDPDPREAVLAEQREDVSGVTAIGLGLSDDGSPNLRCVADEKSVAEAQHEGMEPDRVPGALNRYRAQSRLPSMRALVNAVITDNFDGIRTVLTETVLHGLDLAARLNRLGPPRLVLGEEAIEGDGLTVVLKQYVVNSVVTAAAASSASTRAPDPAIPALPVRADSASADDQALTVSSSSSSAATPEPDLGLRPATLSPRPRVRVPLPQYAWTTPPSR
jgi:hypothetical protein